MRKLRNAYRVARHWWTDFRWYRSKPWNHDMSWSECARRAWADTSELAYIEDGLVYWFPF